MTKKRLMAILLCFSICVGCLSGVSFAAQPILQVEVEQKMEVLVEQYVGQSFTGDFNGATQCKGFADMLYDQLFQVGTIGYYEAGKYGRLVLSSSSNTEEVGYLTGYDSGDAAAMLTLFSKAAPGDYIQMERRDKGYGHSMIVQSVSSDGVWVLHSNWDVPNLNKLSFFSWITLAQMSESISLYHYRDYLKSGEFTDVDENTWYYPYVQIVSALGLMAGTSETEFSPNQTTTRAMMVAVLYRLSEDGGSYDNQFTDVPSGTWYSNAVGWAEASQIVAGYTDGTFRPNQLINREEMAAILYRYARFEKQDVTDRASLNGFKDAGSISAYAVESMQWVVACDIICGNPDGTLQPKANATRAQLAKILACYVEQYELSN